MNAVTEPGFLGFRFDALCRSSANSCLDIDGRVNNDVGEEFLLQFSGESAEHHVVGLGGVARVTSVIAEVKP